MATPRKSAGIVLTRGRGRAAEVFLVRRAEQLRFFGGYYAFPGGVLDEVELTDSSGAPVMYRRCAARELFEETGVLCPPYHARVEAAARRALRKSLLGGDTAAWHRVAVADTLASSEALVPILDITTPAFSPVRYETIFYHLELPAQEVPEIWPGELTGGEFIAAARALERWRRGDWWIAPPVLMVLEYLEEYGVPEFRRQVEAEGHALRAGKLHPVRFCPGIFTAPLDVAALPLAKTANCFLVGVERLFIVDPGSAAADALERVQERIDEHERRGARVVGVIATHQHDDHVAGVEALCRRYAVPFFAHPVTLAQLAFSRLDTRELLDGMSLDLGKAPDGSSDWRLRVMHTPGHARGHLALLESRYGHALVGDLLAAGTSILIDPPDGHLRSYLASLQRLRALDLKMIHPGHGPAVRDYRALIDAQLEHRNAREQSLIERLQRGPAHSDEMLFHVYRDTARELWPLARRSLAAGLEKLAEEGRAASDGEMWRWTGPPE